MKEQYWTTANGKTIAIGDMTLEHLRNVLRKLIREDRIIKNQDTENLLEDEVNASYGCQEFWK